MKNIIVFTVFVLATYSALPKNPVQEILEFLLTARPENSMPSLM